MRSFFRDAFSVVRAHNDHAKVGDSDQLAEHQKEISDILATRDDDLIGPEQSNQST